MSKVKIKWVRNVDGWKRGDVVTVERDGFVNKMLEQGFVVVLEDYAPQEPARNASRDAWAEFLTSRGYEVHPRATRRALQDMWDGLSGRG